MPVITCVICRLPLTRDEAAGGACPACGNALARTPYQGSKHEPAAELCTRTKLGWASAAAVAIGVVYVLRRGWIWQELLTNRQFGYSSLVIGFLGLWLASSRAWPLRLRGGLEQGARLLCAWIVAIVYGILLAGSDFEDYVFRGTPIPVAYLGYLIIAGSVFCIAGLFLLAVWPVKRWRK